MTKREIVRRAVAHLETETVPYHVVFLGPLRERVQTHFGEADLNRAVGNYLVWEIPPAEVGSVRVAEDEWIDEWGVHWKGGVLNRGDIVEYPLKTPDLSRLKRPDPTDPARAEGMEALCRSNADLYLLSWCGAMFEQAHFLRGMDNLLIDLYENPDFVHGLLDRLLEFSLGLVEMLARFPVDAIALSDDYGHQQGPLISPAHFRTFIKPRLKTLFDAIRATGKTVALHSCGNVTAFVPDLIEIGLDILNPVQPEAMDVHRIKQEFGKDLCLYGGISAQQLIRFGTPDDIRATVRREKELLSRGGGYILAPNLDLTHDMPFENVLALIEAAQG